MKNQIKATALLIVCFSYCTYKCFAQTNISDTILAKKYFVRGDKFYNSGSFDSSTFYYQNAANIYKALAEKNNSARMWRKYTNCIYNVSVNLNSQFKLDEDLILLDTILILARKYIGEKNKETANLFLELGDVYYNKGLYDRALEYHFKALEVLKEILGGKNPDVATGYGSIGNDYYYKGENDKAIEYHLKALQIRKEILGEKHPNVASSYGNIGNIYQVKGEFDKAVEYFTKALEIFRESYGEKHQYVASCYNNIGSVYNIKGEYDKALENFQKALQIRKEIFGDNHPDVAMSYMNIGQIYNTKNEYDKALEYQFKALQIRLGILGEKHPDVAASYMNIGLVYSNKDNADKALDYIFKGLLIRQEILGENHIDVAWSYLNVGNIYNYKGEYEKALKYYLKTLQIFMNTLGSKNAAVASVYSNIGRVYQNKGELDKALEYQLMSLQMLKGIYGEKHPDVAYSYMNIGMVYYNKGEYNKALEYHLKALQIRKELFGEKHSDVAASYGNIGNVYFSKGENEKALEYHFKALTIDKEILGERHSDLAGINNNIGNVYFNKGEFDKALEYYQKTLKMDTEIFGEKHPMVAASYNNVGLACEAKGEHDIALKYYQKGVSSCLSHFNDTLNVYSVPAISNILEWYYLLQALEAKAQIITNKSMVIKDAEYIEMKKMALRHFQVCDTLIDITRKEISTQSDKLSLGESANQVYKGAINLLTFNRTGDNTELAKTTDKKDETLAFYFSEKNKSSVLLEALAGQEAIKFAGIPDSLLLKEHDLKTDINFNTKQLAETENSDSSKTALFRNRLFVFNRSYDSLIAVFEKQFPQYHNLKYNNKPVTVKDIQNLLNKKTAFRSYILCDSSIAIFTLTKNKLDVQSVPMIPNLNDSIVWFRYGLTKTSFWMQEHFKRLGYKLYQQLFPPNSAIDKNIENLIIIPDGELALIPFESLLTSNYSGDINTYKDYPFLIKRYNISYSYSANLFYQTFFKKASSTVEIKNLNDFLAFAPVFDNSKDQNMTISSQELNRQLNSLKTDSLLTTRAMFDRNYITPLPATENEIESIFKLYDEKNLKAKILLHNDANEQFIKSGEIARYKAIHFATHGFVNSEKPELSGLLLEQDTTRGEDGILYSGEIYNLKINADLVVLSACETGLGKIQKGEGIIGLTRALLYAGAKNIIVSLWQVADESTSDLMVNFYKNSIADKKQSSYSEALRNAKLKMISEGKYAHPLFWSPFILLGK